MWSNWNKQIFKMNLSGSGPGSEFYAKGVSLLSSLLWRMGEPWGFLCPSTDLTKVFSSLSFGRSIGRLVLPIHCWETLQPPQELVGWCISQNQSQCQPPACLSFPVLHLAFVHIGSQGDQKSDGCGKVGKCGKPYSPTAPFLCAVGNFLPLGFLVWNSRP